MTPHQAVTTLAEIVLPKSTFNEGDIYAAMAAAGVPKDIADHAYKFTQIAWGRLLLSGMGVTFSPKYFWLGPNGEAVSSGDLDAEPYFVAASSLGARYSAQPGFARLALMSADVQAVNDLLKRGSKPEDIVAAPSVLFTEAPTDQGLEASDRLTLELLTASASTALTSSTKGGRPWWRFW